jgi:hypothetical protein
MIRPFSALVSDCHDVDVIAAFAIHNNVRRAYGEQFPGPADAAMAPNVAETLKATYRYFQPFSQPIRSPRCAVGEKGNRIIDIRERARGKPNQMRFRNT